MNSSADSLRSATLRHRMKIADRFDDSRTTSHTSRVRVPRFNQRAVMRRPVEITADARKHRRQNAQFKSPVVSRPSAGELTSAIALRTVRSTQITHEELIAEQFSDYSYPTSPPRNSLLKRQKLFYIVGSFVFLFAILVSVQSLLTNVTAKNKLAVLGSQTVTDEYGVPEGTGTDPAESPVTDEHLNAYTVAPELPRYIRIPSINVFARVKHTSVDKQGAVDAPGNIHDASWYNESAKPGNANGSSLLLGHVSGWTAPGVFKNLDKLLAGDTIEIEKGSGERVLYEVTYTESVPVSSLDMTKVLSSDVAGTHDLKLMTCSGKFNREKEAYEDRFIVHTKIIR